jgi:hypothetical protein
MNNTDCENCGIRLTIAELEDTCCSQCANTDDDN